MSVPDATGTTDEDEDAADYNDSNVHGQRPTRQQLRYVKRLQKDFENAIDEILAQRWVEASRAGPSRVGPGRNAVRDAETAVYRSNRGFAVGAPTTSATLDAQAAALAAATALGQAGAPNMTAGQNANHAQMRAQGQGQAGPQPAAQLPLQIPAPAGAARQHHHWHYHQGSSS